VNAEREQECKEHQALLQKKNEELAARDKKYVADLDKV